MVIYYMLEHGIVSLSTVWIVIGIIFGLYTLLHVVSEWRKW